MTDAENRPTGCSGPWTGSRDWHQDHRGGGSRRFQDRPRGRSRYREGVGRVKGVTRRFLGVYHSINIINITIKSRLIDPRLAVSVAGVFAMTKGAVTVKKTLPVSFRFDESVPWDGGQQGRQATIAYASHSRVLKRCTGNETPSSTSHEFVHTSPLKGSRY